MTPQRRAIIQVLLDNGSHPTAEQILTRVRQEMPSISAATVYNTLHELVEMDLLLELDLGLGLGERRYDTLTETHDHLVCLECGRVEDVPRYPETSCSTPKQDHGFQVTGCRLTYTGYCPECAAKKQKA